MSCPLGSDREFGPRVHSGCRSFDFTLEFEDCILACLPAAVFLALSTTSIAFLSSRPIVYSLGSKFLWSKLTALLGIFAAQLAYLVIRVQKNSLSTDASLAADILCPVATLVSGVLSYLGHRRSQRSSTVLNLYLSILTLLGIARTRTLWLLAPSTEGQAAAIAISVALAFSILALVLESVDSKAKKSRSDCTVEKAHLAPEQYSSFWSRTSFFWLASTFKKGYTRVISLNDLPPLDTTLKSDEVLDKLTSTWATYDHRGRNSLLYACFQANVISFISAITPRLFVTGFTFAQPFLINATLDFIEQTHHDKNFAKGLVGSWAIVYVGLAASTSIYQYQNFRFVTKLRGSLITLIYQRTLQTRSADLGEITAVSLMGTDVERIVASLEMFHDTWGSLLEIGIASWLLGRQVSLACIAPLALILVFIAATSRISFYLKDTQVKWIEKVQKRLRATSAMLGDMKAMKMLGLSRKMLTLIQDLRIEEINTSHSYRKYFIAMIMLSLTPLNLAPVITFGVYIIIALYWKHDSLFTAQAFTSLSLITLLTTPVIVFIQGLPQVIQCIGNFDRIQEFCNYMPEWDANDDRVVEKEKDECIKLEGGDFAWNTASPLAVLKDISVDIKRGTITAIVGPVGSGKSSLLNALLRELVPICSSNMSSNQVMSGQKIQRGQKEEMAYCSQQAWLENGTIRQNIIGASPWDQKWYGRVLYACGLEDDLERLGKGDYTEVGSKGMNLSGGQKQRVALARSVYSRRNIILLDDVFSGMDAHTIKSVSARLFGRVSGILREHKTTVVLTTHNDKIIGMADTVIVLDNGKVVNVNSPESLLQAGSAFMKRLGLSESEFSDQEIAAEESHPQLIEQIITHPHGTCEIAVREWDATWATESLESETHQDKRRKSGDASIYSYYVASSGYFAVIMYLLSMALWIFCIEFSTIWVDWWSAANSKKPNQNLGMYMGVYIMLGVVGTIAACISAWFAIISIISNSANKLHYDLLKATLRFSEDMELIDMVLPTTALNYTSTLISVFAQIIILAVFSRSLAVALPIIFGFLYILQRFYLQTSRQMRLLMIEAKGPLYTLFSEAESTQGPTGSGARSAGDGAITIRAFGWQAFYQSRASTLVDQSQRPMYMQICVQNWLSFVMNLTTGILAVIIVATVVNWEKKLDISAGGVGVSLVIIIGMSETLGRLIKEWTKLESSIGAVARVKRFVAETEQEEGGDILANPPVDNSDMTGSIEFVNVVARFRPGTEAVLKGVTLSVHPGDHMAVCGRSGSGKTSLIMSLLRMIDTTSGHILLDGVDIRSLPSAEDVRSHINVVPQDPFILPGATIRFSIDTLCTALDDEIVYALKRVGLEQLIQGPNSLDQRVEDLALSMGQTQLLCFARAIIKRKSSKILVLDEATSSLDSEAESLIQDIVDTEFKDCTVISVMHRLTHVRSYNKVALLDSGSIVEFGEPSTLLEGNTQFADLYRSSLK
ncbi:ABC transporter [Penicillium angulare]|uniref:ABC transporter n=1 Tax=Penicillium angulare TaxID=116970 RepID=A0A9W9KIK9_9EURO|nr:ABC transporter [Penicillium angulare]